MAQLVAHLVEFDTRRLFAREGYSSLWEYCISALGFSEAEVANRIAVTRAAREFPVILELLAEGSVHLTSVRLLAPLLTPANHRAVLESARGKRALDIKRIAAALDPKPDAPDSTRKLPARPVPPAPPPEATAAVAAPARLPAIGAPTPPPPALPPAGPNPKTSIPARPAVTPLAPERYKIQFTISTQTLERLELAKDMLRHALPGGELEQVFDRALVALLEELAKKKFAQTDNPRPGRAPSPGSRHIPAAVKRAVWLRDLGRCTFVGSGGRRCESRALLEFHHNVPFAVGGNATISNTTLHCAVHNRQAAELYFGHAPDYSSGTVREESVTYGLARAAMESPVGTITCLETCEHRAVPVPSDQG